ncbi:hypothetical protein [Parvularcula sp. LCG005]|uniref:hypothetical protein n=1 Tax=Parvularcula sp. LCG005 TaxID=3078805 RepID=UPI002943ADEA|nr:hypothetical protein [Parvularcula sp. LCG005]WOI54573.1 hypothetical protein RUI03_06135 [Parvularcula sp. LCG005]
MTIICAYRDTAAGKTWLGSNSRGLVGDTVLPGDVSKWTIFGDWAFAFSGKGLVTDVILGLEAEFPKTDKNVHAVVALIRKALRDMEIGKEDDGAMDFQTHGLLVHRSGKIYDIDGHLSVAPINEDTLWACGSGMDYALGASHALTAQSISPRDVLKSSIEAAIALDSGCPGTPIIEEF